MSGEALKTEQMAMDLSVAEPDPEVMEANVFRPDDLPPEKKDLIRRHRLWLNKFRKEYPMPSTPFRIGVYIRYYNQTKYENYLDYHKQQFQETIALCPRWTLVDFYVDNGGVAPKMENAPEWCRLLDDCFEGKVNLIITQKVKNVSRNPDDIALIGRLLAAQEKPVGIYFINEDLYTLASYYQWDLKETEFLPPGWQVFPESRPESLLPGGRDAE